MRLTFSSLLYGLLLVQAPASLAGQSGPDSTDTLVPRKAITAATIPATCIASTHTKWTRAWSDPEFVQLSINPNTGSFAGSYGLYSEASHNSISVTYQIGKTGRFGVIHSGKTYYLGIKPEASQGFYPAYFWTASQMAKQKLSYALCVQCSGGQLQCFTESTGHEVYMLYSTKTSGVWTTENLRLTTGKGGLAAGVGYGTLLVDGALN